MEVFKVFATLGLDTAEFQKGLEGAEQKLRGVEQTFGKAGRTLTAGITLPFAAIAGGALKAGGDFEAAMNQVRAVSGATGAEFDALRQQARDLGATTQFSASEAAEAMNFMAMAGMNATEILGAMPDALKLAAAAQLDMGTTADVVTNIMAGYGMTVDQLSGAVDVLVQAFTNANTDLPQLAEAMKYAGPIASAAGVSFEEAAAAIGLMGNAGIQGTMAGTSLRGAIARMLNPTSKVTNLIDEMNLSASDAAEMMGSLDGATDDLAGVLAAAGISFTDAEGRLRPLDEILAQLEPHASDAGFFLEVFGQRAGPAMAALVSQGSAALRDMTGLLENSTGRAAEVAAVQMEGFNGSMRLMKSAVEALLISIADSGLLEAAAAFVTTLAGWIQNLSETNPLLLRIGVIIGGVLAALGPLLMFVGMFAGAIANLAPLLGLIGPALTIIKVAFTALTGPIGLIIAAVSALVWVFATDFLGIRTWVVDAAKAVWRAFVSMGEWIGETVSNLVSTLQTWAANLRQIFDGIVSGVIEKATALKDGVVRHFQLLVDLVTALFRGDFSGAFQAAKDILANFLSTLNEIFGGLPAKMLQVGKDLMMGLVDGVKSMMSNAVDAVKGVGNNIVDGFKGLLGIQSPSKVFHEFGEEIGQGLADGIDASTPTAVTAIERLGSAVASAGRAMVSGALSPENIIGGITKGLEGRAATAAIEARLAQLQRQRDSLITGDTTARNVGKMFIDPQVEALEAELRRLREAIRESTREAARSGAEQNDRFARSVTTFDAGVRSYSLAQQRY